MTAATYYATMADGMAMPSPYMGLNVASTACLRAFQGYSRGARFQVMGTPSGARWIAPKQARVHAVLLRVAVGDGRTTMAAVAAECAVAVSTVSRTILKLQAWGILAVDVVRGRNGGIRVWRVEGSRFAAYARAARQALREQARKARVKLASTLQGTKERVMETVIAKSVAMDATFTGRVLYARAYLALEDPEGEHDPLVVAPLLDQESIENAMLLAQDEQRRRVQLMIAAAERGDWEEWDRLAAQR